MPKKSVILSVFLIIACADPLCAEEISPGSLYRTALTQERHLRAPGAISSLNDFRSAITAYAEILRRFPASIYSDYSLWQSSGLAIEAYDRYRQNYDLEIVIRSLRRIKNEYPASQFTPRITERLDRLIEITRLRKAVEETSAHTTLKHIPDKKEFASVELAEEPLLLPTTETDLLPPRKNTTGNYSIARQLGLNVSRIVIDPGHGGRDPGARSNDLSESDLVLDIARRLTELLSTQPGLEVIMTRSKNSYVSLKDRTALANQVQADLFISIHANASRNLNARGVETYFLNLATDQKTEHLAARENAASTKTMNELRGLLQSIAINSNLNESRDFAETVQSSLLKSLRTTDPNIPDLGVKQAPFLVLVGAQMPSILSEISFITNREDATLLSTENYRSLVAKAFFNGIMQYRKSLRTNSLLVFKADEKVPKETR